MCKMCKMCKMCNLCKMCKLCQHMCCYINWHKIHNPPALGSRISLQHDYWFLSYQVYLTSWRYFPSPLKILLPLFARREVSANFLTYDSFGTAKSMEMKPLYPPLIEILTAAGLNHMTFAQEVFSNYQISDELLCFESESVYETISNK